MVLQEFIDVFSLLILSRFTFYCLHFLHNLQLFLVLVIVLHHLEAHPPLGGLSTCHQFELCNCLFRPSTMTHDCFVSSRTRRTCFKSGVSRGRYANLIYFVSNLILNYQEAHELITYLNNNATSWTSEPLHRHLKVCWSLVTDASCWNTGHNHSRLPNCCWPLLVHRS